MEDAQGLIGVCCPHCGTWQTTTVFGGQLCFTCGRRYVVSRDQEVGKLAPYGLRRTAGMVGFAASMALRALFSRSPTSC